MRQPGFYAACGQSQLTNEDALAVNVPFLYAKLLIIENNGPGIGRELRLMSVRGVNAEEIGDRACRKHIDAVFILGHEVLAIRAETQVAQITAQWGIKLLFRKQAWQCFFGDDEIRSDDRFLPAQKLLVSIRDLGRYAVLGQRCGIADKFAEPLGIMAGPAEKVGPEAAFIPPGLNEAVKKINIAGWLVTGPRHGIDRDAIGNQLFSFFTLYTAADPLGCEQVQQAVPLFYYVFAVSETGDAEHTGQIMSDINGGLPRNDVANLVPQKPRQLVFTPGQGNDSTGDVN